MRISCTWSGSIGVNSNKNSARKMRLCLLIQIFGLVSGFSSIQPFSKTSQTSSFTTVSKNSVSTPSISSTTANSSNDNSDSIPPLYDATIVGGGPAGLLSAIMLAQKFPSSYKIKVFDRLSAPPDAFDEKIWSDVAKFYLIGLGGRGQKALKKFNVWDKVDIASTSVLGRKDWAPDSSPDEGKWHISWLVCIC